MYDEAGPSRKGKKSKRYDANGRFIEPEDRSGDFDDYEIESALRTISKAAKIRKNKALMAKVRQKARELAKAAQATAASV
ncbi:MAG: hypothetical protein AB7V08_13875 [Elusimicrobiales bacterium]